MALDEGGSDWKSGTNKPDLKIVTSAAITSGATGSSTCYERVKKIASNLSITLDQMAETALRFVAKLAELLSAAHSGNAFGCATWNGETV